MVKTPLTIIFVLLLAAQAVFGVVALPPAAGTNNLAAPRAGQIREISQRSFESGQLDQLQKEVSLIQAEFLFLAIAVGAAGAASVLTIRNLREAGRNRDDHAKESNTNK
jgi:hypothetical protein